MTSATAESCDNWDSLLQAKQFRLRRAYGFVPRGQHVVSSEVREDIDKDIGRTLPRLRCFQNGSEGAAVLRSLLLQYAAFDPSIGYCQSMNTCAAVVLLHCGAVALPDDQRSQLPQHDHADESKQVEPGGDASDGGACKREAHNRVDAHQSCEVAFEQLTLAEKCFWKFAALMDRQRRYYTNTMCGVLVDRRVLDDLLRLRLPELFHHLQKHQVETSSFASSWFLCAFVESPLPLHQALEIWLLWLEHGDHVLFQTAMSLFFLNQERILTLHDVPSLLHFFMHEIGKEVPFEKLKAAILDEMLSNSLKESISSLREFHQYDVVSELHSLGPGMTRRLSSRTDLTADRIRHLWKAFIGPDPWNILLYGGITTLPQFHRALIPLLSSADQSHALEWHEHGLISGVLRRLMIVLQSNRDPDDQRLGTLNFADFIDAVSVFVEPEHTHRRLDLCFRFCRLSNRPVVSRADFECVMDMFNVMHTGKRQNNSDTELFCQVAFEKAHTSDGCLDLRQFAEVACLHPQILNFFKLDDILSGGVNLQFNEIETAQAISQQ